MKVRFGSNFQLQVTASENRQLFRTFTSYSKYSSNSISSDHYNNLQFHAQNHPKSCLSKYCNKISFKQCIQELLITIISEPSQFSSSARAPSQEKRGAKIKISNRRGFSKNCWKPKLTDGFGCIICNQQKNCASVETSLATVHARAQEMGN